MHTEGHDPGRTGLDSSTPASQFDPNNPGYELTDVNSSGIAVFLAGLFGFVVIFFFVCYGIGILINGQIKKIDGPPTKWTIEANKVPSGKDGNLVSNPELQQQLQRSIADMPEPRLDIDDGNQATADLHAKEDLLLDHYSSTGDTLRIPIDRAMELVAERGLPVAGQAPNVAAGKKPAVQAPLTTGFARTGFELTTIEARAQKLNYGNAETAAPPTK